MNFIKLVGEVQFLNRSEAGTLLHILALYIKALDSGEVNPAFREKALPKIANSISRRHPKGWEPDF